MSVLSDFYANANRQLPLRWVSGNSYALDADVWSAVDGQLYRRIVAGAGATDPSADATNWKRIAASGVKSVQRVDVIVGTGATVATASITAVNTAKATIQIIGKVSTGTTFNLQQHEFIPDFSASNTVRVTRFATSADSITVGVQVVEWY